MPESLSSRHNPRVKALAELAKKPKPDSFLIEGFHMVEMAAQYGYLDEVFALQDPHLKGIKTTLISQEILEKIACSVHPEPILGLSHAPKAKTLMSPRVLVLDRVQDPGNVGTILRTALSFSFADIIFLPGTCSPFNAKSLASSQGAIFGLNLLFPNSSEEMLELLDKQNYFLLGSALKGAEPLESFVFPKGNIALVLGNEGQGMSPLLLDKSDALIKISLKGIDSLNVAVAGGILMHALSLDSCRK